MKINDFEAKKRNFGAILTFFAWKFRSNVSSTSADAPPDFAVLSPVHSLPDPLYEEEQHQEATQDQIDPYEDVCPSAAFDKNSWSEDEHDDDKEDRIRQRHGPSVSIPG